MKRFMVSYQSMTAFYDLGEIYAESQEEAERIARSRATAFDKNERALIKARESRWLGAC